MNDLISCVQLEETRVSRQVTVPRQVCFQLNPEIISQIEELRENNRSLSLKAGQLIDIRYYAWFSSGFKNQSADFWERQSHLTFASSYWLDLSQIPTTVIRSTISFEGQIAQEIQQTLYQDRQLLLRVTEAHHWLVAEILKQLPLTTSNSSKYWLENLWLAIAIPLAGIFCYFVLLNFWAKLVIVGVGIYLLKLLWHSVIIEKLRSWLINNLNKGFLSQNTNKRQIALNLLLLF